MNLGLSTPLSSLVELKFRAAQAAGSLLFSATELALIRAKNGLAYQLRYCPALAKKPTATAIPTPRHAPASAPAPGAAKRFDPFENPQDDLLIAKIPAERPSHWLVLNKYPVIPAHFILATIANKPQTHLLEEDDLGLAYACLKAWEEGEREKKDGEDGVARRRRTTTKTAGDAASQRRLFAFFNSGDHSGASQPHRHLQFLPVEHIKGQASSNREAAGIEYELLIDSILKSSSSTAESAASTTCQSGGGLEARSAIHSLRGLPFTHFAARITPGETTASELHAIYRTLVDAATEAVREFIRQYPDGELQLHATDDGSVPISYNLSMTTSGMVICPRRREGDVLRIGTGARRGGEEGDTERDEVALNGTILGGTLMVKAESDYRLLQEHPEALESLLRAVGLPKGSASEPSL